MKRHLRNVHVKNGHIEDSQVERYFALGLGSQNIRGPPEKTKSGKKNRGRWKRWCPQPNCNYLGAYLPHHLQNKHCMKPSSTHYRDRLQNAVKYKGLDEELEKMAKPMARADESNESNEESDEEEIIPPTPAKRKAASSVMPAKTKAKAPAATNTSAAPSQTSKSSSKTSMPPPVTSEAANQKKTSQTTAPPVNSEKKKTSQSSKPSDALQCQSTSAQLESSINQPSNEDPEDDSEYLMAKDFFEERDPKNNRHKWLCYFYRYLFTPTAGFHKDRNRLQHANHVRKLIEETDPGVMTSRFW